MEDVQKKMIETELKQMGFNFAHFGTIYIIEAIQIIYNSDDKKIIKSIEKNIYPIIAKKYSKKTNTIKSDVIKATNCMNERYFMMNRNNSNYIYDKLTPKSVINNILLKLDI